MSLLETDLETSFIIRIFRLSTYYCRECVGHLELLCIRSSGRKVLVRVNLKQKTIMTKLLVLKRLEGNILINFTCIEASCLF